MKFIENIKEEEYLAFCQKNNAHFLQTWAWGLVNKECRSLVPCYVGLLDDNNNLIVASLLLKKITPFNMTYFYAPRGFVMNMQDKALLKEFTKYLKIYLKKENGIYLKVDPAIKYHDIDMEANKIAGGANNYQLFNNFIDLGYIHKGFTKIHERNQPRYTFRINLKSDFKDIEDKMNRTFLKTVRRSYDYNLEIRLSDDINTFYNLIKNNALKDNFREQSLNYYNNFFTIFKKYKQTKMFEAILKPREVQMKLTNELKDLEEKVKNKQVKNNIDTENIINRLKSDIGMLSSLKEEEIVVCSLICVYTIKGAWTLYIGNGELGTKVSAVNRLYYEAIKDAYENKYDFIDLFGTVGDPHTNFKKLAGLHEFKRKMGGEYIEFLGEFDLVNKKLWYKILPPILKVYRQLRRLK